MTAQDRIRTALTVAVIVASIGAIAGSARARLLVYEPFDYPEGILTAQGGALGTTGSWYSYDSITGDGKTHDWYVHPEGTTSGVGLSGANPSVEPLGMHRFDGTVDNLPTSGGYAGLWGADDWADPDGPNTGEPGRYLDAHISLDPSVTAMFQSGATTWFSYVAVRGWDRNEETPNLTIGTDPTPNESRGASLTNNGNGIGTGGGPPRDNRIHVYPMFFENGNVHNLHGAWSGTWNDSAFTVPEDGRMDWQELDGDGYFGPANIVVGKIEWDADTGGEDIISVVRFLETDELTEANFNAMIAANPNLSSANWDPANKPNLDQSQFDTLNLAGCKFFVDEVRIATTFEEVVGGVSDTRDPDVDAGVDMVTWSGQPVQLDPNVVNNDVPPLTFAWSADPADNVVFEPGAEVEAPAVTIIKPGLVTTSIPINNAGFENPVLADGRWESSPPAWTDGYYDLAEPGVWVVGEAEAGVYNPTAADGYGGVAPEGDNVAFTTGGPGRDKGLSQVLSATLQANTRYELSALVGNPYLFNGSSPAGDYRIELLAGGALLASDTGPSPADDTTWKTASLVYESGENPARLGEPLEIRLLAVNLPDLQREVDFDDVQLIAEGPAPDPYVVKLTLAVNNEGNPPAYAVTDDLTISVYDDACGATKAVGIGTDHPGDFNKDCITDYQDLAELAAKWLAYTGLAAPIVAPVTVVVPDVTGISESEAQSILADSGLTTSSTYEYDESVPLNDVITQDPPAGRKVIAGSNVSLVVSMGPPPVSEIAIADVYLAQTHVLRPDDPLFKLVGNRPALLKVQVVGPKGSYAPPVTAVLQLGDESTTLTLDGPEMLPTFFEGRLGKVNHQFEDSFTTLIPAEWVQPGLSITVTAGDDTVTHDIRVGAPTVVKMKMFDVHYFGLGSADYPAGAFEELEAKWPVSDLRIERVRGINFYELVVPARGGAPHVRVTSKQDYTDQTGLPFDGEQAAALQWVEALSASGGNFDVAMQYINIIGVPAGGQAGGFDGVGAVNVGILNHELGHALSLPHWGDNPSYPYKGEMYGIEPQPDVYKGTHVGPTWAFDLPSMTFIPPTVQENSVGGVVGCYKKSPMQGGGTGDQEQGFFFRHFSDYGVNKMQSYLEGKVAVLRDGKYYKWNDQDGDYTKPVTSDGVRYPIEEDVQVISVMASTTLSDMNVNMVYPPIGPYEGNLILTFDPTNVADRALADAIFCPSGGCDFSLRVVQGGQEKTYMLPASGIEGSPYSTSTLKTAAVNLRASDGSVTRVELLLTPDAEKNGLPADPEVLYVWSD